MLVNDKCRIIQWKIEFSNIENLMLLSSQLIIYDHYC